MASTPMPRPIHCRKQPASAAPAHYSWLGQRRPAAPGLECLCQASRGICVLCVGLGAVGWTRRGVGPRSCSCCRQLVGFRAAAAAGVCGPVVWHLCAARTSPAPFVWGRASMWAQSSGAWVKAGWQWDHGGGKYGMFCVSPAWCLAIVPFEGLSTGLDKL
jgi:hypothetical protein